jgi:putative DNA methylase
MKYPKKLIEVALPLDDINRAAAREKSIRHGHPSTLHLWWARRPLAAARAVLFAQLVNDPGDVPTDRSGTIRSNKEVQQERERLFGIIRDLVKWENTNNKEVLERARREIRKAWTETCAMTGEDPNKLPPFWDPFSGGGSIPLEAQRLGLEAHASDLNPVSVLITKALIEIPAKFTGRPPIGPIPGAEKQTCSDATKKWIGAQGLAEDVRRYGDLVREEALRRVGHLYLEVDLPKKYGGCRTRVIGWLWARTVASPNPAFNGASVPLVSNFFLSSQRGKEVWIDPEIDENNNTYDFRIRQGVPPNVAVVENGTKTGSRGSFRCLFSGAPITPQYLKSEASAGRMGQRLMAVVAQGVRERIYLEPTQEMEELASSALPTWTPEGEVPPKLTGGTCYGYGMTRWKDLFTARQLVALDTFCELVGFARSGCKTS